MNHLKTTPSGIDKKIEQLQKPLYRVLKDLNAKVIGFGRVFRNQQPTGIALEVHKGNGEYEPVLDGEDSRFFFYLHNDLEGDTNITAKVDVVCMVNLDEFYEGPERRDEEFRAVVQQEIQNSPFNLKKTVIGTEYLERMLPDVFKKTNLRFSDAHPTHVVTFQTEVNYKNQ
ncbi:MAG: hypothetical protein WBL21_06050 [Salinimicrobium sp.]